MKVSLNWLREYVEINMSPEELAQKMTMAGIAVESIEDTRGRFKGVVVGRIIEVTKHPQADNLQICKVDVGGKRTVTVITAATNVKYYDLVPVALPGSVLADGKEIKEVEFRGVRSEGMLCSGMELGLEKNSEGILIINEEKPLGQEINIALGLADVILELELTPNRGDCFGMIGVAREVSAITGSALKMPEFKLKEEGPDASSLINIEIRNAELCSRYGGRIFADVRVGPSPLWMQVRLLAAGIRPINNIVDITNYVMLEYNQPLHAFDYKRINNRVIVRNAEAGEKITTLDNVERLLFASDLVIADEKSAMCLAGVMGGSDTEVTNKTDIVFLEAATFQNIAIRRSAQRLAMRTEASIRFEKGLDPNTVIPALDRAAYWVETLGIGVVCKGVIDVYPSPAAPRIITARTDRINKLLGASLSGTEMLNFLDRLQIKKTGGDEKEWKVEIPSYRQDLELEADLAEEIARFYGYDKIPVTLPPSIQVGEKTPAQSAEEKVRYCLKELGLDEVTTYSFVSEKTISGLNLPENDPRREAIKMMVPLSEDQAVMRTTLIGNLLETAAYNLNRQASGVGFFEVGRVYIKNKNGVLPDERLKIGVVMAGDFGVPAWMRPAGKTDFYSLKGILEALLDQLKIKTCRILPLKDNPVFHPGRAALAKIGEYEAGWLGEIHPSVAEAFGVKERAYVMELDFAILFESMREDLACRSIAKTPLVSRDLAVVVPQNQPAGELFSIIEKAGGSILEDYKLFDVYTGQQAGEGKKSLAFRLYFRHPERTLKDEEINEVMGQIVADLTAGVQAQVRS